VLAQMDINFSVVAKWSQGYIKLQLVLPLSHSRRSFDITLQRVLGLAVVQTT